MKTCYVLILAIVEVKTSFHCIYKYNFFVAASEGEEVVEVEETDPREKVATMRKRMAMMKARMV